MGKPSQVEPHDPDPGAPAALPTDGLSQPAAMPGVPPELEVLARTARAVAAAEGSEGLAAVIEAVRSLLGAPGAALLRCARARLEPVASYGLEPQAGVMAEAGFSAAAERQGSPHGGYPLRFGGVLEGVLLLAGVDADHLGQQEARLMPLLDLAAIALRNARLTAERSHALAVANRLVDVGQLLASNLDPEAVARAAAEAAVDLLGAEQVGLVLPNEAGILRFTVCAGRCDERVRAYRFKPGEGIVGRAYAEARAYRVDDLWADPRSAHPELDRELGTRSFLAVPVLDVHGQPLGVLMAARNEPGAFTGEEQHLLERLADLTAVALQNARLSARVHAEAAERRRAVEALRESEARFRAVFDRAPVGLSISAPDLRVLALNPAFEQMLGYTIDELNQLGHRGYNHPDDVEEQYRLHAELIEGQRDFYELEKRYRRKDGRWIWAHVVISAIRDEDGQILFVLGMVEDITARREAEQQRLVLAQTEKFRVLGQMASGAAHDLNQYLGLVAGHGEIALNALAGVGVGAAALGEGGYSSGWRALESARESLRIIVQAAFDGAETVRRLQTFTRPQGEGPGEAFAVGALLREVAELTAPRWRVEAQRFGRTIDVDVVEAGDTTIVGWQSSLREALTNLVFNAVDALPQGGRIRLGAERRGDRVEVTVADTGIGMTDEVKVRAFEPFFTTKGERGTGLGLSMVFAVVERHRGEIRLESAPGRGTAFHISLPAAAPGSAASASASPATPGRTLRVLVVDDEPMLATMVAMMLQADGHEATTATSAGEALERLAAGVFDLVISDLGLGNGMNGWDLAASIHASRPGLPVVLATGWGAEIDPETARQRGITAVLAKPYRRADLARVVREVAMMPTA